MPELTTAMPSDDFAAISQTVGPMRVTAETAPGYSFSEPHSISFPDAEAKELRGGPRVISSDTDDEDKSLAANVKARAAREAFCAACRATETAYSENQYYACKDALKDLWKYTAIRSNAYRDLLAATEAAIVSSSFSSLNDTQRDVLTAALSGLTKHFLSNSEVDSHIQQFAENAIDITAPIVSPKPGKQRYRVIIEDCE